VHLRGKHVVLAVRDAPRACADVAAAVTAAAERGGRQVDDPIPDHVVGSSCTW
jgi:hypothetical protein